MAPPVYSVPLAIGAHTGTFSDGFIVPANTVWVMRDIDVYIDSTETTGGIFTVSGPVGTFHRTSYPGDCHQTDSWRGRQVLIPGDSLNINGSAGGTPLCQYAISGYTLSTG